MKKQKTFFTKNNPNYVGEVVSDTPKADANNTLSVNADGYTMNQTGFLCMVLDTLVSYQKIIIFG